MLTGNNTLYQVLSAILGSEVLGEGWEIADVTDAATNVCIVRGNLKLTFRHNRQEKKIRVSAWYSELLRDWYSYIDRAFAFETINISDTKTPEQIGKEVARRLLPGAVAAIENLETKYNASKAYENRARDKAQRIHDASGGTLQLKEAVSRGSSSFTLDTYVNRHPETSFRVDVEVYEGITFKIGCDIEDAEEIARAVAEIMQRRKNKA